MLQRQHCCTYTILYIGKEPASSSGDGQAQANAAYSLLLPGKVLHLNALLSMKKFRDRGNKERAVRGFLLLQEAGLGRVIENKPQRGTTVVSAAELLNNYYSFSFLSCTNLRKKSFPLTQKN